MKKRIFLTMLSFIVLHPALADSNTKKIMRKVVKNYVELIPYIYGDKDQDKKEVSQKIKTLKDAFLMSKHNKMLSAPNFAPIAKSMFETFDDIHRYYKSTQDDFSKYRLLGLVSTCTACHSQLPSSVFKRVDNKYSSVTDKYIKENQDKAYASFFFRDYKKAAHYLELDFRKLKSENSLARLLKVYIVNINDKSEALRILKRVSKDQSLKQTLQITAWKWYEELKQGVKSRAIAMSKPAWIRTLISKYLVPRKSDFLSRVSTNSVMISYQIQRIFYNYLVYHPTSNLAPDLLYWLGILENKERSLELYTLGEMYFEQCILKFPKSAIAPRCLGAYSDALHEGFTGSSGTQIPLHYLKKLNKYKKMVLEE